MFSRVNQNQMKLKVCFLTEVADGLSSFQLHFRAKIKIKRYIYVYKTLIFFGAVYESDMQQHYVMM